MKKLAAILAVFILGISLTVSQTGAVEHAPVESKNENVNVLIGFKNKSDVERQVKSVGGKIKNQYKKLDLVAATIPTNKMEALKKNKNVIFLEEDMKVRTSQTQDWGISKVGAPIAWSNGYTGQGVKIGVIDTGVSKHEDLIIAGGVSVVSYTQSYLDDDGHGTHVTGIISAENNTVGTVGIAPNSDVYAIKALDSTGSGYISEIVSGIDWSIVNGMDIINLSVGTNYHSDSLKLAVDRAYQSGILVVAAAGNDGSSNGRGDSVDYPARYSSVIAVGATTETDSRAYFSSTGDTVEVAAPGSNILSTYLGGGYETLSGTSMATPYVSGLLSLLIEENPSMSHVEIRTLLQETVKDIGHTGKDTYFGYGLIQANQIGYVPNEVPSAPLGLDVVSTSSTSVILSWPSVVDATHYVLSRDGVTVYKGSNTSFEDIGLQAGTTYQYQLIAVNELGNSVPVQLNVTTVADSPTNDKKGNNGKGNNK